MIELALTVTWSHVFLIAPSAQMTDTRSEPLTPAPYRWANLTGAGAFTQVDGLADVPTLKMKSLALTPRAWKSGRPAMSIMIPLMPWLYDV